MRGLTMAVMLLLAATLVACGGQVEMDGPRPGETPQYPDNLKCPPEKMTCTGDVDKGTLVCTCDDTWFCQVNPKKCSRERPVPPGGGNWSCTWESEHKYYCTKKGGKGEAHGDQDWFCTWSDKEFSWRCIRVKTPTKPPGDGSWSCFVDKESKKLVCTPQDPGGGVGWSCKTVGGKKTCTKGDSGDLPPGGSGWKCNRTLVGGAQFWVCYGKKPAGSSPPGGGGWQCVKVGSELGQDTYRCQRPETNNDVPPGGGHYSCSKGSEFGGTTCVKVDKKPTPWTPKDGFKCAPGTKMWCDGMDFCGWGQVTCKPNGQWPSKIVGGKKVLFCKELPSYRRPNTMCACFHFFYKANCCERPDCIVPPGTNGQICPKSKGKLCNSCNPLNPECKEAGAKCLISTEYETYCGRLCASNQNCPTGYKCATVKLKVGSTKQCVPLDRSCHY